MSARTYEREEARRLLEEELRRSDYRDEDESIFSRLGRWLSELLDDVIDAVFSFDHPLLSVTLILVLLGLIVWLVIVLGRPRRSMRNAPPRLLADIVDARSAAEVHAAAQQAAGREDWQLATQEMFRAALLAAVEAGRLDPVDGDTVRELADRLQPSLPAETSAIRAASRFEQITYSDARAERADFEEAAALHAAASRPGPADPGADVAAAGWAVPR